MPEVKVHIVPAQPADYEAIAEIYNEYIRMGNATMDDTLKTAVVIQGWVDKFHDRERLYVMKDGPQVIGWGIIKRYSDREGYRFACETAVYLTASERGKGYGTQIKEYLIAACRDLQYKHLVAKIFADNTGSIIYNERLGYTVVGRQKSIGYKNGRWQDIVIMQYLIE